jgi:DNA-binding winged helix-turn-helix (wHTH) protein
VSVTYEIGPFQLDPDAGVLSRDGTPTALGARAVAVLKTLVEHANEFVPKGRILDAAWPNVVVEEANLAVQIGAIRRILSEAGGERWIETLTGRGYRFVGPVAKFASDRSQDAGGRARRSTLPEALTSFIGRERELAEIKRLLPGKRLLTLVGAGGIGKTRLALQFAAEVVDAYRDGVWLVELAPVAEPALVPQTVTMVLGLKEQPGKSLTQTLTEYLASKHVLLLMDNAEHLLAACAQLADTMLRQCPHVVLLATSREGLGIAGELTYRVPSLSMPDPKQHTTPEQLSQYESVRLFVERAQLQLPQFTVTHQNAPALASVCYRLDGIPLALELAAARAVDVGGGSKPGARPTLPSADEPIAHGVATPPDVALADRLELRAVARGREGAAVSAVGLRRRLHTGRGGSRVRWRRRQARRCARHPDLLGRQESGGYRRAKQRDPLSASGDRAPVRA